MPFITVVANVALEGRWEKTQKGDICSRDPFRHSFDVTWVLSYREFWDLESKSEEWSMKDMIDAAIRKVNQDFHCTEAGRVEVFYPGKTS